MRRIFSPGRDARERSRPRPRARARRRARRPRRRPRAGRRGEGRRGRDPATGSSAPPSSSPSVRQTARSACLPGSSDPMSSRRRTAAPPRVPSRSASRTVIASPPSRPRATSSACFTSRNRSLRSFDADPSTPSPTRTPASVRSRTGATPAPRRRFEVGQCATPVPVSPKRAMSVGREVDAVCAPDVVGEPAEPLEVLDRRAAVQLAAVRLLLDGLGEMRVQRQPEAACERRRLLHQASGDRERGAGRHRDLDAGAGARLVQLGRQPLGVGEHGVELLDQLVGREAAVGDAEVHRAARGDDADAELPRCLHLGLDETGAAAREDVVVVEHRRASRQCQLGEARARRGVLRLRVDRRPHRVQLAQPREQVGLLRACPRERLVQVVVRVDEPGRDDGAGEVDAPCRLPARARCRRLRSSSPSTSTQPAACSVPASSIVTTQAFA